MDTALFLTVIAICAVVLTAAAVFVTYYLIRVLKSAEEVSKVAAETASDFNTVRNGIKAGVLSLLSEFINQLQKNQIKGGDQ